MRRREENRFGAGKPSERRAILENDIVKEKEERNSQIPNELKSALRGLAPLGSEKD